MAQKGWTRRFYSNHWSDHFSSSNLFSGMHLASIHYLACEILYRANSLPFRCLGYAKLFLFYSLSADRSHDT